MLQKYDRWDPEFYLGTEHENEFGKAKKHAYRTLRATGKRLIREFWGIIVERARTKYHIMRGDIKRLD